MTKETGLTIWQTQLEDNKDEIKKNLIIALQRTGLTNITLDTMDLIHNDIKSHFPKLTFTKFMKIINNGGMGKYGVSYIFSVQTISNWIYKENEMLKRSDAL